MDDFSKYPESVTSIKAGKEKHMNVWTPRDAIIEALRDIDRNVNQVKIDAVIVCWREVDAEGKTYTRFCQSGPDAHTTIGLIEVAKSRILTDDR